MTIARNNVELAEQFDSASKLDLMDVRWLESTLRPHCKLKFLGWRGSRLRLIQHPTEFARWLILLAEREVRSYLEVGTSTGGSFFTTDSYLRAAVQGFGGSVGYDRTAKLRDLDIYSSSFPETVFRHQNSADMNLTNERYDAAFVDARHEERWVLQDFEKVRNSCNMVGFHDILRPGVDRAWSKIRAEHSEHWEFTVTDIPEVARCGIGAVATGGGSSG